MDYIKRFCERSIEISLGAEGTDSAFNRGIIKQAEETLKLIEEIEKLDAKYHILEKK